MVSNELLLVPNFLFWDQNGPLGGQYKLYFENLDLFYDSTHQDISNDVLHLYVYLLLENLKFQHDGDFGKIQPPKKCTSGFQIWWHLNFPFKRDSKSYENLKEIAFHSKSVHCKFFIKTSSNLQFFGKNDLLGVKMDFFDKFEFSSIFHSPRHLK